jgi:membrane-associated phospholipid phosphatase
VKQFFSTLPNCILACFQGRMILWHLVFIAFTFILVRSGFDWYYFCATRSPVLREWMFPSAPIGGLVPLMLPLVLILSGFINNNSKISLTGWAIGQAALIGSLLSSAYKAVTGRVHPEHFIGADLSHGFRFGWLRGGVFWGWPSSHTTIAFAMAATVVTLFPKQRWLRRLAIFYAVYIGLGVSMTIHWFSDFVAGAILGLVIGVVVGRSFSTGPGKLDAGAA